MKLKIYKKVTERMYLTFQLMMFALKYEHISAFEGTSDGSSQVTPTFEVEIKAPLEGRTEFHLKLQFSCTQCKRVPKTIR